VIVSCIDWPDCCTMKAIVYKATKKKLRHSIIDFNPPVVDSIRTG
jgi:hypothetical protein